MGSILVTGATGNVGQEVVRTLLKQGAQVIGAAFRSEAVEVEPGGITLVPHPEAP